jgi:hypothetical protein
MTRITPTPLADAGKEPRAGVPGAAAGLDRGWQLEMEKAQTRQWFHGAIGQGADVKGDARPRPPAGGELAGNGGGCGAQPPSTQAGSPDGSTLPGGDARAAAQALAPVQALPGSASASSRAAATTSDAMAWRAALQVRPAAATALQRPVAAAPAEAATPAETKPVDVRLHVEEGPDGLRVWFGLAGDGPAVAARAEALLAQLRRECSAGGQRLALVVCNGETLFEEPVDTPAPIVFPHPQEP